MIARLLVSGSCILVARTLVVLVPTADAVALGIGAAPHRAGRSDSGFPPSEGRADQSRKFCDSTPPTLRDLLHAYRSARSYRRCVRLLHQVDVAIERGDRVTAEKLMGRIRVVLARVRSVEVAR